jgi:hypothetical protein
MSPKGEHRPISLPAKQKTPMVRKKIGRKLRYI